MPDNIDVNLPLLTVDLDGDSVQKDYLSFGVPLVTVSLSGTSGSLGTFYFEIPEVTVELEGTSQAGNNISFGTPLLRVSLSGTASHVGSIDFNLPVCSISLTGDPGVVGSIDFDLPVPVVNFTAVIGTAVYKAVVLNTESMSVVEYESFPFNSLYEHKGSIYGITDDGLYLLTGDDDNGSHIEAYYKTALVDFGTSNRKRISDIISRFTSPDMRVSVVDDSGIAQTSEVLTGHAPTGIHTERAKPGKGMKSKAYALDVYNVEGHELTPLELEIRLLLLERKA